ncbi:MAG: response regulator [Deltaproteobacteria bacterium]|nr:response regulator [Deltaproteobacteria bacterium]
MSAIILVAASDPFDLRMLSELCVSSGYQVLTAADGGAVLDMVARDRPDLLLIDTSLPVKNGFEVLRVVKADADLAHIPTLLVTFENDVEGRRQGLELGAEDYITRPFRAFEIQQRLRNALRTSPSGENRRTGQNRHLADIDVVDSMTGTGTVNQLYITLDYEFTRAVRYRHPLGCIVVHIRNHEEIEKRVGSDAVNGILVALASGLRGCIRGVDHLFRSGQGEFTILLPETDLNGCQTVINRLRSSDSDLALFHHSVVPRPQIAVGLGAYPTVQAQVGKELYQKAREATE